MMPTKRKLLDSLWRGADPIGVTAKNQFALDLQGWNSQHPYLIEGIHEVNPTIVVEIGVWKGGSTIFMASELKRRGMDSVVIAIDTWLGSSEHWSDDQYFGEMNFRSGYPAMYHKFISNVKRMDVEDHVVPLPLDSLNAAHFLTQRNISPNMIHLDGGHDYDSVMADLRIWWPLLSPGGMFIGDDYDPNGAWVTVRQAFDDFFGALGFGPIENSGGKCRISKPAAIRNAAVRDGRDHRQPGPGSSPKLNSPPERDALLPAPEAAVGRLASPKAEHLRGAVSCADGMISGWLFDQKQPSATRTVAIELDGFQIATVAANGFDWSLESTGYSDSIFSRFQFQFPSHLHDEIIHLVQIYDAETGYELTGSPLCLTFMVPATSGPVPIKSVSGLGPSVAVLHDTSDNLESQKLRDAISFELKAGSSWIAPQDPSDLRTSDHRLGGPFFHRGYRALLPYIVQLHDVFTCPENGQIFFDDGSIWRDCTRLSSVQSMLQTIDDMRKHRFEQTTSCMIVSTSMTNNYFHWHGDTLPGIHFLRKYIGDDHAILGPKLNSWQKQSLQYLGVSEYIEADGTWRVQNLFTSCYSHIRSLYPDQNVKEVYRSIRKYLEGDGNHSTQSAKRIFISREDALNHIATNESEIWSALESRGFHKLVLSSMPYADQIRAFETADLIVATHGAGLTNIGFCKPGTKVLEITPNDLHNGCYRYLSILMQLRHFWVPMGTIDDFTVDVDKLLALLLEWE